MLRLGVEQLTRERQPQGPVRRTEDAQDAGQLYGLAIALEDAVWLSNDDKRRVRDFVTLATLRIEQSRAAGCRWYQLECRLEERARRRAIDKAEARP